MSNALVSPDVLAKIDELNSYHHRRIQENIVRVTTAAIAKEKLVQAGIKVYDGWGDISVRCEDLDEKRDFLLKVHAVLGRLKEKGEREVIDSRRHIIKINCQSVDYPGVEVSFPFKLPKGSKCKIQKVRVGASKGYTTKKVVCSV